MKKGTTPGFSGLQAEHLIMLFGGPTDIKGQDLLRNFTTFLDLIANGSLPQDYFDYLAESHLIAIQKSENDPKDVRPIAMPELYPKLVGNMITRMLSNPIKSVLGPFQLGCGFQFATEAIIHGLNQYVHTPGMDILQFDFQNAFNNADRLVALKNIREKVPSLYPFARAMYINQTKLWVRTGPSRWQHILSCQGARQGDSIGGVIFNFAMYPLLSQISIGMKNTSEQLSQPLGKLFAYYDDLSSAAPMEQQISITNIILAHGPRYGLFLNQKKSAVLLGPRGNLGSAKAQGDQRHYKAVLKDSRVCIHPSDIPSSAPGKQDALQKYGSKLLGTPIGSDEYINSWLNNKFVELEKELTKYKLLKDCQCEWLAFSYCFKPKINHLYRTIACRLMSEFADRFEGLMKGYIGHLLQTTAGRISESALFPIKDGGLGLDDQEGQCHSAFLASSLSSIEFLSGMKLMDANQFNCDELEAYCQWYQYRCIDYANSFEEIAKEHPNVEILPFRRWKTKFIMEFRDYSDSMANKLQKMLYDTYIQARIASQIQTTKDESPKDMIQRFNSLSHEHAGKFLLAIPVIPALELSDHAFRTAVKQRCFTPHFSSDHPVHCDCRRNMPLDQHGDHLFTCNKNTELWYIRHDAMVNCFAQLASEARISHVVEPRRSFQDITEKRPDLILYNSHLHRGATIAIDVSITHPVSPNHSNVPGSAMKRREDEKRRKYGDLCKNQKMDFQGFIFETYGRFSKNVEDFIKVCCKEIAQNRGVAYATLKHQWVTRISATLQRANSYFFASGYRRLLVNNTSDQVELEAAVDAYETLAQQ